MRLHELIKNVLENTNNHDALACLSNSLVMLELFEKSKEWQPIEDIPDCMKDGRRVLFFTPGDDETGYLPSCQVSYYLNDELDTYGVMQWEDGLRPSHWMPLPTAPEASK